MSDHQLPANLDHQLPRNFAHKVLSLELLLLNESDCWALQTTNFDN